MTARHNSSTQIQHCSPCSNPAHGCVHRLNPCLLRSESAEEGISLLVMNLKPCRHPVQITESKVQS